MAQNACQQAVLRVAQTNLDPGAQELPQGVIEDAGTPQIEGEQMSRIEQTSENQNEIERSQNISKGSAVSGAGLVSHHVHSSYQPSTPEFYNRTESNPRHDSSFHEPDSVQNISKNDASSAPEAPHHHMARYSYFQEEYNDPPAVPEVVTVKDIMDDDARRKEALHAAAMYFMAKRKYDKVGHIQSQATICYKRLILEDDENGPLQGALAHCYLAMSMPIEALAHFQKALNFLPDIRDPNLWIGIATAYEQLNNPVNASHAYIRVCKLAPNFPQFSIVQYHLGCNLQIENRLEGAIKQFKNALLLEPENTFFKEMTLLHIGQCYEQMKDAAYHAALRINKQSVPNTQKLAWLYFQQGNITKAIETLNDVLPLEQSRGSTHYMLGRCYMRNQEFLKAHSHFESAIKFNYHNPEAWCSCGVLYAQLGQLREALQSFRVGTVQDSSIPELWYNIGVLYENNNQITPAYFAYSQAIQKQPSFQVAAYRRSLISSQNQIRTPGAYIHPKFSPNKDFFLHPPCYRPIPRPLSSSKGGRTSAEDEENGGPVGQNLDSMSMSSRNGIPSVSIPSWNSSQAYIRSGPMLEQQVGEGQAQRPQSIQIVPLQGTLVQQVLMTQNPQGTQTMSQFYPLPGHEAPQQQQWPPQPQSQRPESQQIILMQMQENQGEGQSCSEGRMGENKRGSQRESGSTPQPSNFSKQMPPAPQLGGGTQPAYIQMPQASMPQIYIQTPEGLKPAQILNQFPTSNPQPMMRTPYVTMGSQGGLHQVMVSPQPQSQYVQVPQTAAGRPMFTQPASVHVQGTVPGSASGSAPGNVAGQAMTASIPTVPASMPGGVSASGQAPGHAMPAQYYQSMQGAMNLPMRGAPGGSEPGSGAGRESSSRGSGPLPHAPPSASQGFSQLGGGGSGPSPTTYQPAPSGSSYMQQAGQQQYSMYMQGAGPMPSQQYQQIRYPGQLTAMGGGVAMQPVSAGGQIPAGYASTGDPAGGMQRTMVGSIGGGYTMSETFGDPKTAPPANLDSTKKERSSSGMPGAAMGSVAMGAAGSLQASSLPMGAPGSLMMGGAGGYMEGVNYPSLQRTSSSAFRIVEQEREEKNFVIKKD